MTTTAYHIDTPQVSVVFQPNWSRSALGRFLNGCGG